MIGSKIMASGIIWLHQVRCFAIPTPLMVTTLATQVPGNKNNTLRKSLQTTSALSTTSKQCFELTSSVLSTTSKRCFEQPAASFLVCSLIFIEYKKSLSFKEGAFYLRFCHFLICPKAFFVLK